MLVQPAKASLPISVTVPGIVTVFNDVHPWNACEVNDLTPLPKVTVFSDVHSKNAP